MAVSNQQDVDSLKACRHPGTELEYTGDIIITPEASGDLDFRGHGDIDGTVVAENNRLLKTLHFEQTRLTLDGPVSGFILKNLANFVSLASDVRAYGTNLSLEALPLLDTININTGSIFDDIHLNKLPMLRNLQVHPKVGLRSTVIDVRDVGLNSVDSFFRIGYGNDSIFVAGIPNVNNLSYSLFEARTVSINGNGNLSLLFNCTWCEDGSAKEPRVLATTELTVSGLSSFSRNHARQARGPPATVTLGTLRAIKNPFTTLNIDFTNLNSLIVQDNPNLESIRFNGSASSYTWADIVITGNPKLRLNSSEAFQLPEATTSLYPTFFWPLNDSSSMIFKGAFSNEFL